MVYTTEWTIRFGDIDWFKILYYPCLFDRLCVATEEVMEDHVIPFHRVIEKYEVAMPIVNAEADFLKPIKLGDEITITVEPKVGETTVTFVMEGTKEMTVFKGEITHAIVNAEDFESSPVPEEIATSLESI